VCFDRRSAGASDTPMFGQPMSRHGRDLAELLAHLGLDGAVLVGASMGANVLWAPADLYGTLALAGVVAVDQTPKWVMRSQGCQLDLAARRCSGKKSLPLGGSLHDPTVKITLFKVLDVRLSCQPNLCPLAGDWAGSTSDTLSSIP
jgi:pimeloyl-ACP methyl ester carboxylesterase